MEDNLMKRLLLALLVSLSFAVSAFAEVKLDSLTWLDADTVRGTNDSFSAGGPFYIGRQYVNLRGDIGKDFMGNKITGRLTVDFTKPTTPIKYAYFDWNFLKTDQFSATFSGGLMKSYFGNLPNWEYPIAMVKDLTEGRIKPSASADFGVMASIKAVPIEGYTKNLISLYAQILNGEGYEKIYSASTVSNDAYAFQISPVVTPIDGLNIGATYRTDPYLYENNKNRQE